MSIARRERQQGKKGAPEDAAIRVAGSFLVDNESDDTPTAIRVSRGIHEGIALDNHIEILTRDNRELDARTAWYEKPLRSQQLIVYALLRRVYPNAFESSGDSRNKARQIANSTEMTSFALRWKPLSNPNAKLWTRNMILRAECAGVLEVEVPYVLIRGTRGISEMNELATLAYIKRQLL